MKRGKGGGAVIFNQKIFAADIGNFEQGFLFTKLTQNSNFRVQGMFCIEKNQNKTHFEEGTSKYPPPPRWPIIPPRIYATISVIKSL